MKSILELLMDLFTWIMNFIKKILVSLYEKFLEISLFEKLIVINTIPAFFAVILPSARFAIFDGYHYISNPLSHYMIGITFAMLITIYFPGFVSLVIREAINALYFIAIMYLYFADKVCECSYEATFEITAGYYINMVVPVLYMIFAFMSNQFDNN